MVGSMAKKITKIFLSASIPYQDEPFYNSTDVIAVRDSIKALATVIIPKTQLIWGGHPAITPLIKEVYEKTNSPNIKDHVTIYQSRWFEGKYPKDNEIFGNIIYTEKRETLEESLSIMRKEMFENDFSVGIFIGGKQGIIDEFEKFKIAFPEALILPVASTGGATKKVYEDYITKHEFNDQLRADYAYMSLFKTLLKNYIE